MEGYLTVDVGGTTTKATLFDSSGAVISTASRPGQLVTIGHGRIERDMEEVWETVVTAIRECRETADVLVRAVGVVGHSDGLYPIDSNGIPAANAIQATDTRAAENAHSYRGAEGDRILEVTGTRPFPGSPASICRWLLDNDPSVLSRARWLLFVKDWVRYRLTGQIATDPTDAAASFLEVNTGTYSEEALDLYGLAGIGDLLPPIQPSFALAGELTPSAAGATGLTKGVPVVTGCHDVDAAALGLGATGVGQLSVVAGTFSINQLVTDEVLVGDRWQVRSFVEPGRWLAMSTSPTSASNLGWFAEMVGADGYATLIEEVEEVVGDPSEIIYLPYLFGAPDGGGTGAFVGLASHHRRAHLTRAVLEGVVLSHRLHLDWLSESYDLAPTVHLTGGASNSPTWMQMFADGLGRDVLVGDGHDTARGGGMLAALGTGRIDTLDKAVDLMSPAKETYRPGHLAAAGFEALYERFLQLRDSAEMRT